ncbi:hypothetical protein CIHG_10187 [Coccidioides immitis H538.4]|uniref:Myb-like domain-containing protein n=2 Tax=Coccidioides immitis TaxID=5501 RepID=A0A0J8UWS8_COCIT|nr:hypothetical protein CIRG_02092 [Coccidioides immitis RMSCC 2394]KMU92383.1 hypothetical protein CIHG_10187 [Coccidioides immitis H538.4]TPX25314.1 hypothetical protein DIZ76_010765 [Coccidioides immitis]
MPASHANRWQKDEDIFVAALRLGTNFDWKQIEVAFQSTFEGSTATKKDLESRFNKNLKPQLDIPREQRTVADAIDDYRHYGRVTYPEDQVVVDKALEYLGSLDPEDRLW